jgi:phage terminase large subunit
MRWEDTTRGGYAEMWFSWNPDSRRDAVDDMFRNGQPPTNSVCVEASWKDNPWFPKVLEIERQDCLNIEPDQYAHVWDGDYVGIRKGAYFAKQMAIAKKEGRIGHVSADPYLPVRVYCDIGGTGKKSDAFAIWITQFVAREIRVVDYYEAVGQEFKDHIAWLRENGYGSGNAEVRLPHDGATHDKVHRVSYETAFKSAGYRVKVIPNQGTGAAAERIREVRKLFPMMFFDRVKCAAGLESLSNYHEKWDEIRDVGLGPNHNWASHGADSFGLMAIDYKPPTPGGLRKPRVNSSMKGRRLHA